jgi:lipopolysaccharide transport system ATP-binding protein
VAEVIKVEGLCKNYRVGLKEETKTTLFDQIGYSLMAPIRNYKNLRNLTKFNSESSSIFRALDDINFQVNQGEVLGIVGHNGAGKSTLLKLLSRITSPSAGKITLHGKVASLLEVGTGFHQDLTGRENIYMNGTILGMTKKELDRKLDEIIDFSGIEKHIDTPVKFYSSGMGVRLGFAVAAHLEPEILIVDEVLAVGDIEFQNKCLNKMENVSSSGKTILFVSHNMAAIKSLCKRGIVLKKGSVVFDGEVHEAVGHYLETFKTRELQNGIIPDHISTHSSGEAKFKRLLMYNIDEMNTNHFHTGDLINIRLNIDVFTKLGSGLLDIKIVSKDGIEVSHLMNLYDGQSISFTPGSYEVNVRFNTVLQPGVYYLTIGIHKPNGYTVDYVESINEFEIVNSLPIQQDWIHGYTFQNAKWEITK